MRFFCLFILIFLTVRVWAQTNETIVADYTPYLNGKPWPQVPVIAYVEKASNLWVHPTDPSHFPTIQETSDPDADFTTIILRLPDGTVYKTYNAFVLGPYLSAVYSGDFNHDGKPDFMAIKPGAGNGLAGECCFGIFAFSNQGSYSFTRINTMGLGPHDLVLDPATKEFRLIHTSFRQGLATDGTYHSFWVHRFFEWDGQNFREDSNLPPIWIQYLNRPNHQPTKLLTPELKAKAWDDDPESKAQIEW
ncbi:MAG TPA: hypothetical protein VNU95_16175 [Candidatus Acidoferrales bacterium]|jgi:hypothetical protein|nr:hypothetical protein [Candidatus Acidoferrales bacterium]